MMSDRDLLRDFAERRSECAFQTLVQRHINLVFGTALRQVGQATAAQEVTQDVFIALARRAAWLRVETSLAGWLYQTTVLKCRQRYRADSRRQQREQTAVELSTTMKDDDSVLKSLAGVLDEGLLELRESERQALLLRFFDGRNHREVGLALGIGEDAARKRVDKALAQLTDFFKKRGYAIGSVALAAAALEAAAVPAPAGLAAQAARAALAQASVGPLHWLADCLAKLLCPNKAQTAVVCTALLLGPGLWQGARWLSVIEEQRRLEALLATLQTQRDSVARERTQIEQQLRRTSNRLAQLRSMSEYTTQLTEANLDPRLFRWDESADYVRVSKTVMRWLTFRNPDNDDERTLNLYGAQVSPTLLGALGLNAQEQASVQEFFQGQMKAYQASAQSRSYLTNLASLGPDFSYVKLTPDSRAWVTPALTPEESKAWSEHFQAGLSALIGPERAEILLRNANDDSSLSTCMQRFGSEDCIIAVTPLPDGGCKICRQNHFRNGKPRWYCSAGIPMSLAIDGPPLQPLGPSAPIQEVELWRVLGGQALPGPLVEYLREWSTSHQQVSNQAPTR